MFRRLIAVQALVAVCSTLAFAEEKKATETKSPDSKSVITKSYRMGDLEVFRQAGGREFARVTELLESKVGEEEIDVQFYPQNLAIVVTATDQGHTIVAKVIEQEREKTKAAESKRKAAVSIRSYRLRELPLYDSKPGWDPSILIELLKARVGDDQIKFKAYEANLSLVVTTTGRGHDIVGNTVAQLIEKPGAETEPKAAPFVRSYAVSDLAVSHPATGWDPSLLVELIKAKIGNDRSVTITPDADKEHLVVSGPREKHEEIVELLEKLRGQ